MMPSSFEAPTDTNSYRSGFFLSDLRAESAQILTDWVSPGKMYDRVKNGMDGDKRVVGASENSAWEAFSFGKRWAIRLIRECLITRKHSLLNVWCCYATFIPANKLVTLQGQESTPLTYLGATWTAAKNSLIIMESLTFWELMWTLGRMDEVVAGWEQDSA